MKGPFFLSLGSSFGRLRFLYSLELRDFSRYLDMPVTCLDLEMERNDSPIDTSMAIAGRWCLRAPERAVA